jgi:phosphate-selective porin OprO and OprP
MRVPVLVPACAAFATVLSASAALAQDDYGITVPVPSLASTMTLDQDGLNITSDDGEVTFHVGGRVQVHLGDGSQSTPFYPHFFEDHVELRRARLDLGLSIQKTIEIAFQYDFASRNTPIADAVIAYTGLDDALFTVGNFKEPVSLEQLISDSNTMFVERSLMDALVPGRNTGFAVGANGEAWTFAAGVFGGNINDDITDDGIAGSARFTYAPVNTKSTTVHLGASGSYRAFGERHDTVSFGTEPEANIAGVSFVDTGDITDADSLSLFGVEGAVRHESFRAQGEYMLAHVDRRVGGSPTFQGGYLEAAYVLNGAAPSYSLSPDYGAAYAVFGGVKINDEQRVSKGGFGVVEVAGRFSFLDLEGAGVRGGSERDWTAGLNWYPDYNLRVSLNYINAYAENAPQARGRDVSADIFVSRLQVSW